jgi:hypothetical protein
MKRILAVVAAGAVIGLAHAQPAKPAAAPKGPSPEERAMERAVANYKKNQGMGEKKSMGMEKDRPAAMGAKAPAKKM